MEENDKKLKQQVIYKYEKPLILILFVVFFKIESFQLN